MTAGANEAPPIDASVDLPTALLPLHRKHGTRWEIGYEPLCRTAPYTARPRGGGRRVRADTVRLLDRVLCHATPELGDAPPDEPFDDGDTNG